MNRMELLQQELAHAYEKEDWYPPLKEALAGVTAAQANWRPQGEAANTIWENVNHLLFYKERFLARFHGTPPAEAEDNDATFAGADDARHEAAWNSAVARLQAVQQQLQEALAGLEEADFDRPLPNLSIGRQLTSLNMHDAYHTGQIVQIRKLQGSWPASRSYE